LKDIHSPKQYDLPLAHFESFSKYGAETERSNFSDMELVLNKELKKLKEKEDLMIREQIEYEKRKMMFKKDDENFLKVKKKFESQMSGTSCNKENLEVNSSSIFMTDQSLPTSNAISYSVFSYNQENILKPSKKFKPHHNIQQPNFKKMRNFDEDEFYEHSRNFRNMNDFKKMNMIFDRKSRSKDRNQIFRTYSPSGTTVSKEAMDITDICCRNPLTDRDRQRDEGSIDKLFLDTTNTAISQEFKRNGSKPSKSRSKSKGKIKRNGKGSRSREKYKNKSRTTQEIKIEDLQNSENSEIIQRIFSHHSLKQKGVSIYTPTTYGKKFF